MRTLRHRTAIMIGSILAVIALVTTGAAGAGTHWFGLASPHYTQQIITGCNADWRQITAAQAMARAALANLDPGTAQQWLAKSRAALHEMKMQGCPSGPYPLSR